MTYHQKSPRGWSRLAIPLGICACIVGFVATILPLWPLWGFYQVPIGTTMRPMALTLLLWIYAAGGLFLAMPLSVASLALGWRCYAARWVAVTGFILSISAICTGFWLFGWIVTTRQFVLND